jgi:pilin isopeptide linkage protein
MVFLSWVIAVGGIPSSVFAAETSGAQAVFNVVQQITGDTPKEKAEFSYIIEANDEIFPMPEQDKHIATITINDGVAYAVSGDAMTAANHETTPSSGNETPDETLPSSGDANSSAQEDAAMFASLKNLAGLTEAEGLLAGPATFKITYTTPGRYTYTIRQQKESLAEGYKHDDTIYHVVVDVQSDLTGRLGVTYSAYTENDKSQKSAGIVFTSDYDEPETEPATEPQTEPVTEPQTEPVTEPQTEPVTEPQTEPVTEPQTEPATEPQTEPATEPQTEPATEPQTEPATEPQTEPVTEPQTEPTTEPQKISVEIDKVDADTGAEVSGAVLRVIDANGATVDQWTSNGSVHTVSGLTEGANYKLIELSAPTGYKFAKDITFTAVKDQKVVMSDQAKPKDQKQNASITVTKQLTCSGNIIGAKDQVFYVALYEDAECTHRISEIKTLAFKMASSVTVTFDELEPNQTYYIGEADVNGINLKSGMVDDGTLFVTNFIQGQAVTASTNAGAATLKFLNEFSEIPHNFYREGELDITKQLIDVEGNAKTANATFYAGIFADPDFTTMSDQVTNSLVPLELSETSEASATVGVILPESGTVTLYVTEVDADGIPVSEDASFAFDVTIDGSTVSLDGQNTSAQVTITNQLKDDTETLEEPEQKQTGTTSSGTGGSTATSVKTGDNTPTELYLILLAASACIILLIAAVRRRRRDA